MAQSIVHFDPARRVERGSDKSSASRLAVHPHGTECPPDAAAYAARRADDPSTPAADLPALWRGIVDRRYTVCAEGSTPTRRYVVARTQTRAASQRPLSGLEAAVLGRVLYGDQQKLVAADLGIACSTTSKWYTQAIQKTRLDGASIPLPIVFAAQSSAAGRDLDVDARCAFFDWDGDHFFSLSTRRPRPPYEGGLTQAELEIATLLVEGALRSEIARLRATSTQTVACQLRGIFSKFRLSGRYALVGHAERLGWFT